MALLSVVLATLLASAPCYAKGCPSSLPSAPSVTTRHGTLQGGKCNTTDVNFFLSIPYANPPKRFHAPAPYTRIFNKRNATVPAPACPQFGTTFIETEAQSEDWYVFTYHGGIYTHILFLSLSNDDQTASSLTSGLRSTSPTSPSCLSRYGYLAAAMKQAASPMQCTQDATPPRMPSRSISTIALDLWGSWQLKRLESVAILAYRISFWRWSGSRPTLSPLEATL